MFKTANEFEKAINDLLINYLDSKYLPSDLDNPLNDDDFKEVNEYLINSGMISGVRAANIINGNFTGVNFPHVTYTGLRYLRDYQSLQENK